jgi:hypothetical protein
METYCGPSPYKSTIAVDVPIRIVRPVMKSARAESLPNGTVFHYAGKFYVRCELFGIELNGGHCVNLSDINHAVTIYRVTELTEVFA